MVTFAIIEIKSFNTSYLDDCVFFSFILLHAMYISFILNQNIVSKKQKESKKK